MIKLIHLLAIKTNMENPVPISFNLNSTKIMHRKIGLFSFIIVMLFGAILTLSGLVMMKDSLPKPSWIKINGQVVSITPLTNNGTTTYSPVVNYEVNSQLYTVNGAGSSSSRPDIGSSIAVAYDPAHPEQSQVIPSTPSKMMLYGLLSIGILSLIIAPIVYFRSLRGQRDIKDLKINGHRLPGVLTNIQTMPGINHELGYKIVVSATNLNGQVQHYVSDNLSSIGSLAQADFYNSPIAIDVYVNPSKPEDYYVDVAEIPNLTPARIAELIQAGQQAQPQTPTYGPASSWVQPTANPPASSFTPAQPTYPVPPTYPTPTNPPESPNLPA